MARQVFALLPSSEDGPIEIAIRKGGEWVFTSDSQFQHQADDLAVVFAPAVSVTAHRAVVSARNEREALQSAPFTLEDDLAQPVELLHVALGPRVAAGQLRDMYVVNSALMDQWNRRLVELGLRDARIVPELSVVPSEPAIIAFKDRCLVSVRERRYGVDLSLPDDLVRALTIPHGEQLEIQRVENHSLVTLAELLPEDSPVDLRQGRFAVRRSGTRMDFQSFRLSLGLLLACFTVWISYLAIETATLNSETRQLRTEASNHYTALFPDERNVSDPAQRIRERNGGAVQTSLDFRTAASALYEAALGVEGAQMRSLRYDGNAGTVRASLSYAAYGDDAKVRQALEGAGLTIHIGDSRQEQGRVIGDLILEAPK